MYVYVDVYVVVNNYLLLRQFCVDVYVIDGDTFSEDVDVYAYAISLHLSLPE